MNYNNPDYNFQMLLETRDYLLKAKPITREWYEFHRNLILEYAVVFPNCSAHLEMDDPVYTEEVEIVEIALHHLKDMIEATNIYPPSEYLYLVSHMIDVIERAHEMKELNELMETL